MKKIYIIGGIVGLVLAIGLVAHSQTNQFFRFEGSNTVYKAYSSAVEFFRDGGAQDFSNVEVRNQEPSFGSVGITAEYNSTTTGATGGLAFSTLKVGQGTLGSVVITIAGAGYLKVYDATTTDANLRTNKVATSSLEVLASFGGNQAVGTYVFDTLFYKGLLFNFISTQGSTTITWR